MNLVTPEAIRKQAERFQETASKLMEAARLLDGNKGGRPRGSKNRKPVKASAKPAAK